MTIIVKQMPEKDSFLSEDKYFIQSIGIMIIFVKQNRENKIWEVAGNLKEN